MVLTLALGAGHGAECYFARWLAEVGRLRPAQGEIGKISPSIESEASQKENLNQNLKNFWKSRLRIRRSSPFNQSIYWVFLGLGGRPPLRLLRLACNCLKHSGLRLERCSCGDNCCAMFYTKPKPEGSFGPDHRNVAPTLEAGAVILDIVAGQVSCVEVLDRHDVRQKLDEVLS